VKPEHARTALVLYGSETGNAQDVAEEVGRLAERLRFDTTVLDLHSVSLRDLVKPTVVIFCISTTGQGDFPQNARRLWRTLLSGALKPGLLRKVRFASFGLGDSSYVRFNVAHRMLHGRLVQLGAKTICERGEGNEQHPEGHSAALREWIVALKERLLQAFPLPDGLGVIAEDVFLEPKWKLDIALSTDVNTITNGNGGNRGNGTESQDDNQVDAPSSALLPVKGSHTAEIVRNERVTAEKHFQDVRVLDLRIAENHEYGPGAVAVIYPKNFPKDVQDFINLMDWQHVADKPLSLMSSLKAMAGSSENNPSPLRHLDLSKATLTVRWLLENVLDIMSIPRRSFFSSLAHFAGTETEDERYQKERLLELANPELIDELWDYTTRPKRTIVEVMMDFTTIKIPWQYVLSVLPMMKGRQFSIASGGKLEQDEAGGTKVELLIAIADPPSPIIKWRRRYGVCTRYVTSLKPGQQINIGLQQGYLDVQPTEINVPVVMIGPGTGLAPMRAMIHQRLVWAAETAIRPAGKLLKGDILFFGCRAEEADYFFRNEWHHLAEDEGLTVCTAFSRDPNKPKQYVQDQIRENAQRVREALLQHNGKVYICGSSGNMPKGVREALIDVLGEQGAETTREEAEKYLDMMEKEGRYKQETW
jgi:sulfite reductase alpha subunit-like flavoprotein